MCSFRTKPVRRIQTDSGGDHGAERNDEDGVASGRRSDDLECCVDQFYTCNYGTHPFGSCAAGHYCPSGGADYVCKDIQIYTSDTDSLAIQCPMFYYTMAAPLPKDPNPTYICPSTDSTYAVSGWAVNIDGVAYYNGKAVVFYNGIWYVVSAQNYSQLQGGWSLSNVPSVALARSSGSALTGFKVFTSSTGYQLSSMTADYNGNYFGTVYCPGSSAIINTNNGKFYYGPPFFRLCIVDFYCPNPLTQIYCSDLVATFAGGVASPSPGIPSIPAATPIRFYLTAGSGQGRGPFYPYYQKDLITPTWAFTMRPDGRWRLSWFTGSNIAFIQYYNSDFDPKLAWPDGVTVTSFQSGGVVQLSTRVTCANSVTGFGGVNVPWPA